MVEIDPANLGRSGKSIRLRRGSKKRSQADCSYGKFDKAELAFTAWEFFHAAKKTELASSFTAETANRRAFAFALEHEETFIWDTKNFRKQDAAVFELEDFAQSGLAGRVGEAVAYLAMVKRWGYVFWDRCATVWARAARRAQITHDERLRVTKYLRSKVASERPEKEPDFIFEKATRAVALTEAKGGFVHPNRDSSSVKADLRKAQAQLAAWSSVITPTPKKMYGIGTYLREEGDSNGDPSLIAYFDPSGQDDPSVPSVDLPRDLIRRCNYGAWLIGMGLVLSGRALRDLRGKVIEEVELPVFTIGGRRFAVTVIGWKGPGIYGPHWIEPWEWDHPGHYGWSRRWAPVVMGIDVNALHQIGTAIQNPDSSDLVDIELGNTEGEGLTPDQFRGSLMPDGTLVGTISRDEFRSTLAAVEAFNL